MTVEKEDPGSIHCSIQMVFCARVKGGRYKIRDSMDLYFFDVGTFKKNKLNLSYAARGTKGLNVNTFCDKKKEIPKKINRDRVQSVRLPNETFVVEKNFHSDRKKVG